MQRETMQGKVTKLFFTAFTSFLLISSPDFVHLKGGGASDPCLYIFSNFIFSYPPLGERQTILTSILKKCEKQQVTGLDGNLMLHTSTTVA